MELTAIALVVALASQVGNNPQTSPSVPDASTQTTPRPKPNDLAADAVRLPAEEVAKFGDVTLTEVLSAASRDPGQRLRVVQAYWRLWKAFADRAVGLQLVGWIEPVSRGAPANSVDAVLLEAELASAKARLEEAEVAVRAAQVEVCGLLGWNTSGSMPRPIDPPHVGIYHTHYETIYARRSPTERTLLIHQTLPIYHQAIGAHGVAWQTANDVVAEQQSGYHGGQVNVENLLSAWHGHARQQQELCRVAWEYNDLIAEYAVPLAGQQMETPRLVGMLIRPTSAQASRRPGNRADATAPFGDAVEQAGFDEPIGDTATQPESIEWENNAIEEPQPPNSDEGGAADSAVSEPAEGAAETPADEGQESERPAEENSIYPSDIPDADGKVVDPFSRRQPRHNAARRHIAVKPVVTPPGSAIFANFTSATAAPRTVIEAMFGRLEVVDQNEEHVNLRTCLAATSATRYAELLDVYVLAWQAATNYQADADAAAQLHDLRSGLLARRNDARAAADMLVLRAAETAYAARMLEQEAAIWRSAVALGAMTLPRTPGRRALPSDPPVWAGAAGSPTATLTSARAQGLVAMDRARTQAMQEYVAGRAGIGLTLQAVGRQNDETRAFATAVAQAAAERSRAILAELPAGANTEAVRHALLGESTNIASPTALQNRRKISTP